MRIAIAILVLLAGCDATPRVQVVADAKEGGVWIVSGDGAVKYCHVVGLDPKCRKE